LAIQFPRESHETNHPRFYSVCGSKRGLCVSLSASFTRLERFSYYPESRVKEIADGFRSRNLPCDVVWMDIDYMNGFRIFTFDPVGYPDPAGLSNYLHQRGFKGVWMIDPAAKFEPGYSIYDSGVQNNSWVKTKDGQEYHGRVWAGPSVFPDFTQPHVRDWWGDLYRDFLARSGADGVWNDMNEPSVFHGPQGTMPIDNRHEGGGELPAGTHEEYHNLYGLLMVNASRNRYPEMETPESTVCPVSIQFFWWLPVRGNLDRR
jgi:alpha-glucosidase